MTDDLLCGGQGGVTPSSTLGPPVPPAHWHPTHLCAPPALQRLLGAVELEEKSVGATQQFSLLCLLQASIMTSSRNSGAKERPGEVKL